MSKHGEHRRTQPASSPQVFLPPPPQAPLPPPPASPPLVPPGAVRTLPAVSVPPPVVPRPQVTLVPSARRQRRAAELEAKRRGRRRASVISAAVVAVLAVVAGVVVTAEGGGQKPKPVAAPGVRTQHTVLLSLAPSGGAAVESVLLAHDSANAHGAFVLIPSDIVTEVAGHGSMLLGNAATFGPTVPGETLSDMISVTVDGDWQLTPEALASLVDHLGGITVNVPINIPVNGQTVVAVGDNQLLNGNQASALATYIAADEPSGARLARFQSVLVALMAKLGTDQAGVTTILRGLATGSTMGGNAALVGRVLAGLDGDAAAQNVAYTTLPTTVLDTGDSTERLAVDGTGVAAMVKQYFSGSVPPGRVPGRNRVIVLNGTGKLGLGQSARERLTAHGLVFVRSANQPGFGYTNKDSVVIVPDATPDSLAAGNRVAIALGLPTTDVETSTVDTTAADVITILGRDYKP